MTNIAKKGAGFVLGLALVAGMAAPASAQSTMTNAQLQAQIQALLAQIAALQAQLAGGGGATTARCTFTRDLTVGSRGADVTCLQTYLTSTGHYSFSGGATGYFGPVTRAAVARWQAANGITPAAGYFGPVSRAKYNAIVIVNPGTPGTPGTPGDDDDDDALQGGEGQLNIEGNLGDVENTVEEGEEDVNVLGVELEADDSDIMIERVDVDFAMGTGGSDNLDDYITEVSLWLDGEELARLDVDEGDEDDDIFSFRFSGLDGVIREGDTGELYVAVTAVNNVDTNDTDVDITVDIEADGIRAVDAEGLSETYGTEANIDAETFQVDEATVGDLEISEGDENPDDDNIEVSSDAGTDDVTVLAFELEAGNQDVEINDIPVSLAVTGATDVDALVTEVRLLMDGDEVASENMNASAGTYEVITFDDLDITLEDGETAEFTVVVDIDELDSGTAFDEGDTLVASTSDDLAGWDVEDVNGEDVTPDGSVTGGTLTFFESGITAEFISAEESVNSDSDPDLGTFRITLELTAFGDDIYVSATTTTEDTSLESVAANTGWNYDVTATTSTSVGITSSAERNGDVFTIEEGETETFTFTVVAGGANALSQLQLGAIRWGTDDTDTQSQVLYLDENEFQTDQVFLSSN